MQLSVMIMNSSLQIMHTHWQKLTEKIKIGLNRQLFFCILSSFFLLSIFHHQLDFLYFFFICKIPSRWDRLSVGGEENLKEKIM